MAAPMMVEKWLKRIRNKTQEELDSLYSSVLQLLNSAQPSERDRSDCLSEVRKLFLYLSCTKYRRRLPEELVDMLKTILTEKNYGISPGAKGHILCSAILQEYAPTEQVVIDSFNPPVDLKQVPFILPVVMSQGQMVGNMDKLVSQMVRWVSTVGFDSEVQARALGCLVTVVTLHRPLLSGEQIYVVSSQISDWLSQASLFQAPNPNTRSKPKKADQVTEIDGTTCQDFFTLLNLSQYYSQDQLLNLHSFSCLRQWLLGTHFSGTTPSSADSSSGKVTPESPVMLLSSGSFATKARQVLVEKACEYCLRVIDQCERKPLKFQDQEMMQACLIEAVSLLDVLCSLNHFLVAKIFPAIKGVYNHLSGENSQPRVLLPLLQFFIHHSEMVVYNPIPAYEHFFGEILSSHYTNPVIAFDTVMFCRDNLQKLCVDTDILEKFFPNLLKILAWNPRTFLMEFVDILPAMISPSTAVEMLHTLLDLPCEVMALEVSQHTSRPGNQTPDNYLIPEPTLRLPPTLEAYRNPEHKPWFNFILRGRSGQGDTISKLGFLHKLLSDTSSYPRVVPVSQAVPVLLRLYFQTVVANADGSLLCQLVPVMMERAGLLFNIPSFTLEVRKVLADELLAMFKQCPALIMDLRTELLDYVATIRNINGKEDFFTHVVWIIGDYSSTAYDSRCNTEVIIKFYEALETLLYEVSSLVQSSSAGSIPYSARLLTVCMTALAKLASRCQDLIPRVLLCLTKVSQQQMKSCTEDEHKKALLDRANELINVLKLPDVAAAILSPSSEITDVHWHEDVNTSIPLLLQATHQIVQHGT
ncbi:AP-5 complex subunit zeta-1-like [Acanthaster planci]|uniref:AP-5 complex subunit zeta-1-like n=1 Tax=Acanthaster planci TaxID=133434 RepID=A0A8B7ZGP5_ACAPL|nr:AP-5 complex subunit zeta-1-like [Acanthaster planci]